MILYHGGTESIENPVIRHSLSSRDFGTGFYCTDIREQAEKWAIRQGRVRKQIAVLNIYDYDIERANRDLNIKIFDDYVMDWLNLIIKFRNDKNYKHSFDIVYGKIANDDVGETVQAVINGLMPPDFALQKLVFMPANNQYCFCTEKSLAYIKYIESIKLE
ncbi:MAG: DUF3990 domain-containing protein [Treponema sp.]|nr:DUF3990 domain-containing protein [Treponema sp.]